MTWPGAHLEAPRRSAVRSLHAARRGSVLGTVFYTAPAMSRARQALLRGAQLVSGSLARPCGEEALLMANSRVRPMQRRRMCACLCALPWMLNPAVRSRHNHTRCFDTACRRDGFAPPPASRREEVRQKGCVGGVATRRLRRLEHTHTRPGVSYLPSFSPVSAGVLDQPGAGGAHRWRPGRVLQQREAEAGGRHGHSPAKRSLSCL